MSVKKYTPSWTKQNTLKSASMFFVHFLILTLILAVLLLWDKLSVLPQYMEKNGANYLYALFCALLLIIILYCTIMIVRKRN